MMEDGVDPLVLASIDESRRDFVKKMLMASAFVLPAVASFPMDALAQSGSVIGMNTASGGMLNTKPDAKADPARKAPGTVGSTIATPGTPGAPGGPIMAPVTPPAPKPPPPVAPPSPPPRRF